MENHYPFRWLDVLVEFRLDPLSEDYRSPDEKEISTISATLPAVLEEIFESLNARTFSLSRQESAPVVEAFQQNVEWLCLRAKENLATLTDKGAVEMIRKLIRYLEQLQDRIKHRYPYVQKQPATKDRNAKENADMKVMVNISVDQLAIILKAADDTRVLSSRSLSMVFRRIIPYVSTGKTANVSWKSARSSTYKMEENDKRAAISALTKLIDTIRLY